MVLLKGRDVTKKEFERISQRIRENDISPEDYQKISDFRAEHSKVIKSFIWSLRSFLKNKKNKIHSKENIIVSQRLKRLPSIIGKVKRFENMSVGRMQDLAGARIILNNLNDVERMATYLRENVYSKKGKNNFYFVREKNYIVSPKEDGYRSVHQIFKYQGKKEENLEGYVIELQIRTKLQHQWATAVEIIDSIKNQSLKIGGGDTHYKEFFKLSSKVIEFIELKKNMNDIVEEINEIKRLNEEYKILKMLSSLRVVTNHLEEIKSNGYLILILDHLNNKIRYIGVEEENISKDYLMYEETYKDENNNVVTVSVENLKTLKKAYPNYFLDAREFVATINKIIL